MFEMTEMRGWQLAHITAFGSRREEFRQCLAEAFGMDPPDPLYRGITQGDSRLVRLSRDQYWWIATGDSALRSFIAKLSPDAGAVTILSAGRVRLRVAGPEARDVLACGIAIDLHPAKFAVGQSAQTGLHHTGIFLERVAVDTYELFVQRTFAASIREWLLDASLAHGVVGT
jgi:sarcosine oxidase subunit gamma